jgi:hypothetical protein
MAGTRSVHRQRVPRNLGRFGQEVNGPATELEKLKEPLAHLNPAWFVLEKSQTESTEVTELVVSDRQNSVHFV